MKYLAFTILLLCAACASQPQEAAQNTLPTTGAKGWPVQNNEGKAWKFVRGATNYVADKTRYIRREAAMLLVPEEVVSNEVEYKQYVDAKNAEIARQDAYPKQYCYKSWTGATCYDQPKDGQEDRLVGN